MCLCAFHLPMHVKSLCNLLRDGGNGLNGKITAPARTTENAPSKAEGAISVWTGKTCI